MPTLRRFYLKGRRSASQLSDAVRERVRPSSTATMLATVQRRIEIVLAATYGRPVPVSAIPEPKPRGVTRRVAHQVRTLLIRPSEPAGTTDGHGVLLPATLPERFAPSEALAHYRLLAFEQAERLARGTLARLPADDPLVRDLYLLREAEQVDRSLAQAHAGLVAALAGARADALRRRPHLDRLPPLERAVEALTRAALARPVAGDGASTSPGISPGSPTEASPDASLRWAAEQAAMLRAGNPGEPARPYRGLPPVGLWGTVRPGIALPADIDLSRVSAARTGAATVIPLPVGSSAAAMDRSPKKGARLGAADRPGEPEAPPLDLPNAPARPDSRGTSTVGVSAPAESDDAADTRPGIAYPEWDHASGQYRPGGVTVRTDVVAEGDEHWALDVLASRASLVRRVQQQFERLRARRTRLNQQYRGDDIDLVAVVRAMVERRVGHSPGDRLYTDVRPARRGLAISLLVDVSGSTDTQVTHALQIIDVEKIALLLATTAFDALGDSYNVLTFTGRGAGDVRVSTVKGFGERSGAVTRRRIAALQPESGTRLGAAVRHATAELQRQPAGHRLLLMLSDGRPNDVGGYMDTYAIEDSRQAILEARAAGIFPFCLTVDRDGADYLPHVFGASGHVVIGNPEQLPAALLRAVRQLLRYA